MSICQKILTKTKPRQRKCKNDYEKTLCDAVKLESNNKNFQIIAELVKSNIPVMGHIGYTPQFKSKFTVEGNTKKQAKKLLDELKD